MRYLKLYENFNYLYIHTKCKKYEIENYTINEDGSIDVDGDVYLVEYDMNILNFRNVTGNFRCSHNNLTSLKGFPIYVGGIFDCENNQLTSLEHCPKSVGSFNCNNNQLTSLEFCPEIKESFYCENNQLTSLKGCPKVINDVFYCNNNKLTSLEFCPKVGNILTCGDNDIKDFLGFVEPGRFFYCKRNPIFQIYKLFADKSYIELLNDYDCIRGEDIVIDRLNEFLEEIDEPTVESVRGYNNI